MDYRLITDLTLYGTEGDKAKGLGGVVAGDGMQVTAAGETGIVVETTNNCGLECDRTFIDAVISGDGSKIRSTYADAWKSTAFCLACTESMDTGLPVKVIY